MFGDLKELAIGEEKYKVDLLDAKSKRQEVEMLNEDLIEKTQNQELKIRAL
jgi:hypothetical protein